MVGMHRK